MHLLHVQLNTHSHNVKDLSVCFAFAFSIEIDCAFTLCSIIECVALLIAHTRLRRELNFVSFSADTIVTILKMGQLYLMLRCCGDESLREKRGEEGSGKMGKEQGVRRIIKTTTTIIFMSVGSILLIIKVKTVFRSHPLFCSSNSKTTPIYTKIRSRRQKRTCIVYTNIIKIEL